MAASFSPCTDYKVVIIRIVPQVFKIPSSIFSNERAIEQTFSTFTDFANKFICIFNYRFETHFRFGNPPVASNGVDFYRSSRVLYPENRKLVTVKYVGSLFWCKVKKKVKFQVVDNQVLKFFFIKIR